MRLQAEQIFAQCPAVQRIARKRILAEQFDFLHQNKKRRPVKESLRVFQGCNENEKAKHKCLPHIWDVHLPVPNTAESFKYIQHSGDTKERCIQCVRFIHNAENSNLHQTSSWAESSRHPVAVTSSPACCHHRRNSDHAAHRGRAFLHDLSVEVKPP